MMNRPFFTSLVPREKSTVFWGGIALVGLLFYLLILLPVESHLDTLRKTIPHDQTLLAWMQSANNQINALAKQSPTHHATSTASVLAAIQMDLSTQAIGKSVTVLQQADSDSIQIHFQQVKFDGLAQWLSTITRTQHLTFSQFTIESTAVGIVNADVKFKA